MADSQFRLLGKRRYGPFFATQAFGALNDNLLKNALVILVVYHAGQYTRIDPNVLTQLAGGLFILPFLLFSAIAGQLADRYDKARIMRIVKLAEVLIMAAAAVGFATRSLSLLLVALFGMGLHSTFFGPAKYAYLPQMLRPRELIGGNALLESGTFLAILLGTLLAGVVAALPNTLVLGGTLLAVAGLGVIASRSIPAVPPPDPALRVECNPLASTWHILREAHRHRIVFLSLLGISWFWALGAVILGAVPGLSHSVFGGDESVVTVLLALFSVGIGAGSLACERLSRRSVEIGLVPLGAFGLTLALALLYLTLPAAPAQHLTGWAFLHSDWRAALALTLIGVFGGVYIVPLYALVQMRSEPRQVSRVQAANNALNALAMVLAAIGSSLLLGAGMPLPDLLVVAAVINAVAAIYIFTLVPEFLYRFLCWCLVTLVYRFRVCGDEYVPESGAALLVCNHVSYADALVVAAGISRPVRFVIYHRIYRLPLLHWLFRSSKTIPIAPRDEDPQILADAYAAIAQALGNGELVCIFPEGGLSADGELASFKPGLLRILRDIPVPVIPLAVSGLWGSILSRSKHRLRAWRQGPSPRKIYLRAGAAVPPARLDIDDLRETVLRLRGVRR